MYERRDVGEARRDLAVWLDKWAERYPKLCDWVEENIEETFSFCFLPRAHHKHMKSMVWLLFVGKDTVDQCPTVASLPRAEATDFISAPTLGPGKQAGHEQAGAGGQQASLSWMVPQDPEQSKRSQPWRQPSARDWQGILCAAKGTQRGLRRL